MDKHLRFLEPVFQPTKPLAKLFRSDGDGYLYDTGTNQIFKCTKDVFLLLSNLFSFPPKDALDITLLQLSNDQLNEAMEVIESTHKNDKILSMKSQNVVFASTHFENYEKYVSSQLGQLILEVTQKCNLRCTYCIYNPELDDVRNHGNYEMSENVAFKAIDYLFYHSSEAYKPAISFYGGEPLLNFKLIKKIVEYSKQKFGNKTINYAITTNGTLISNTIAEYFAIHSFSCIISLDGPQSIHDMYRKTKMNKGSFEKTFEGINNLYEAYRKHHLNKSIGLSIVYMPPFSSDKIRNILEFINHSPILRNLSGIMMTYPHNDTIPKEIISRYSTSEDMSLSTWAREYYTELFEKNIERPFFVEAIVQKQLLWIYRRLTTNECKNDISLNGCCFPFARKMYVLTNGDIQLCERTPGAPMMGNVMNGLDSQKAKKYFVERYSENSIKICSHCWGNKFCSLCYGQSFQSGNISIERKMQYCQIFLKELLENLKFYTHLIKINPSGLNYLADIEVL